MIWVSTWWGILGKWIRVQDRVVSSRNRRNLRGVKRKMRNFPLRPRHVKPLPKIDIRKAIRIVK